MQRGEVGIPGSTHPAVADPPQHIFNAASAQFGVDRLKGAYATESVVGAPEPVDGALMFAEKVLCKGNDARQPVEPVGFMARETPVTAALQAAD